MKLKCDDLLSSFAFKFIMHRYTEGPNPRCVVCGNARAELICDVDTMTLGRGLHSFTLELNLSNSRTHSRFSWVTRWTE